MLLTRLFKAPEFSEGEYAILRFLWQAYLEYDGKYTSFLYCLMNKMPEHGGPLDLSNIKAKWLTLQGEGDGILGAFNPIFPSTIFITNTSPNFEELVECMPKRSGHEFHAWSMKCYILLSAFPIIMHELYHMLQFKTSKVGYIAMRFISIFTTIPYYMFQDAEWMPKFRKAFEWDIEGQAEKYGNLAPHIEEFCMGIEAILNAYMYREMTLKSIERDKSNGGYTPEEIEERLTCSRENFDCVAGEYSSAIQQKGKELFELLKKLAGE